MLLYPPAKINLGLAVKGKRPDGYHNIESVFYTLPIYDALECIENKQYKQGDSNFIYTTSGLPIAGELSTNLVYKAYQLLSQDFELPPVLCHLNKYIPMGAGLGGGSSDGAYMLLLLNRLFSLNYTSSQLAVYAQQLGSDCPFFIYTQAMHVKGRGELLSPIEFSLKGKYFVLIYPNLHISTVEAYQNLIYNPDQRSDFDEVVKQPINTWKDQLYNHFETYAFQKFPELELVKNKLYDTGAIYASMTGSGSAIYGVFEEAPYEMIKSEFDYPVFSGSF
ncbi:MAG: 4-(cytidine 5'-diphospho)-2-C-methyl-D-erythritol kinase [Bacteroidetes bacterium]|nr:4-(cytidine 5'-diphospho)-2-C-methyl-D-erythritol kinase [Bacteroidota bacterium]